MTDLPVAPVFREEGSHGWLMCLVRDYGSNMMDEELDVWSTDKYFTRTRHTLTQAGRDPEATMQIFAKKRGIVVGVVEVLTFLAQQIVDSPYSLDEYSVETRFPGGPIAPRMPVMYIQGPYKGICEWETQIDGIFARRSLVATNTYRCIREANSPVIYFGARHDDPRVQAGDGWAAKIAGVKGVSTDLGASWYGGEGLGTMPHALIAAFGGDTVEATIAFARTVSDSVPIISLVDYDNDVVGTSLHVAEAMEEEFGAGVLDGVRVDTSGSMVDRAMLEREAWDRDPRGVTVPLVKELRRQLDGAGYGYVDIFVSGGFTPEKIKRFEEENAPVDGYGIGSSILGHGSDSDGVYSGFDFTADLVSVNGQDESKRGRGWFDKKEPMISVNMNQLGQVWS